MSNVRVEGDVRGADTGAGVQVGGAGVAASRGAARVAGAFADGPAFIPFVTCGDPDVETTEALVLAMADAGADLIEIGIPFSDPMAEGVVIQQADERALAGGVTTDDAFALVERLRARTDVPLAFMTYANVVYSRGIEAFAQRMARVGVDALILPDVPFEEKEEFAGPCREAGVALISLVAPTSQDRTRAIAREAEGFVYCVSSLGVTGVRSQITGDVGAMVRLVKEERPDIPCAIGFGISTPEQARAMGALADGVIVGSAIVRMVGELGRESVAPVAAYVREMKAALG